MRYSLEKVNTTQACDSLLTQAQIRRQRLERRMLMQYDGIVIKPYTHQDLATLYGVSWATLQRWLKPHQAKIGEKNGHFYTTRQVEIIFNLIGWPPGKEYR